jgi:hypothetical protein
MTSNQALVRDNSTLANFKNWAKAISDFFITAGWTRTADTGQVNWSTIASVPAGGAFVYEILQTNDGATTYYLKVEYGTNATGSNNPEMRFTAGTSTTGTGNVSGLTTGVFLANLDPGGNGDGASTFNCYFSGDAGRMCIMMWRDVTDAQNPWAMAVQRSINASGTYTNSYFTLAVVAYNYGSQNSDVYQQSVVFGVGSGPQRQTMLKGGLNVLGGAFTSEIFNGSTAVSPVYPEVGIFDNPMDALMVGSNSDFTEGQIVTIPAGNMPYGTAHTYVCSQRTAFLSCGPAGNAVQHSTILLRYD